MGPLKRRHSHSCAVADTLSWLPTGAPDANATFFCEDGPGWRCFFSSVDSTDRGWFDAQTYCQAQGGQIVMYESYSNQYMVEKYFEWVA